MKTSMTIAIASIVLAACSATPKKEDAVPQPPPKAPVQAPVAVAPVAPMESAAVKQARRILELAKKSIYFDYDNYTVKPEYQSILKEQAEFMRQTAKDNVMLSGNADERGSAEYNLALGQKRAEAVRKALVILGVPDSRLEAVSYGKEKPRAICHEESCWQENRRVDFAHKVTQ